jgi:Asp-tRNA(Asn)/Glu-tRNA(Gln) amidotransferase A subunit family amidase
MSDPFLDATAQAELIRSGEISSAELVDAAITRIEGLNPELNAVVIALFDKARAEVRATPTGPFAGVPYVIKDHVLVTDGDPHAQSVAALKAANVRGTYDSYYVQRMRAAGFVLVGKTNMPELALGPTTEPVAWGPARNPWDTSRSTGGSSGGSAAAVAAGMVPVAEGTDGGGSIRMPASHCGVIGLKPTRGRVSAGPDIPASDGVSGMGTEGCIGRSVRDIAAMLDIVSGHRPGDAYNAPRPQRPFVDEVGAAPGRLRIGVLDHDATGVAQVDPHCVAAARAAADLLSNLGHDVVDGFPARLRAGTWPEAFLASIPMLIARELERLGGLLGRPITQADVERGTWTLAQGASQVTAAQHAAGIDSLRLYAADVERWWEDDGWDLLLTPTMPTPPPPIGAMQQPDEGFTETAEGLAPETFTVPYNVSGQPAISLPLHWTPDGLPVGVQLVAGWGREHLLLRVASQLETVAPWRDRHPPVAAQVS